MGLLAVPHRRRRRVETVRPAMCPLHLRIYPRILMPKDLARAKRDARGPARQVVKRKALPEEEFGKIRMSRKPRSRPTERRKRENPAPNRTASGNRTAVAASPGTKAGVERPVRASHRSSRDATALAAKPLLMRGQGLLVSQAAGKSARRVARDRLPAAKRVSRVSRPVRGLARARRSHLRLLRLGNRLGRRGTRSPTQPDRKETGSRASLARPPATLRWAGATAAGHASKRQTAAGSILKRTEPTWSMHAGQRSWCFRT